jgi:hypothetical protein
MAVEGIMRAGAPMLLFRLFSPLLLVAVVLPQANPPDRLEEILKKTGAYCEKLKGMALHFVCQEKIKETINEFKDVVAMMSSGRIIQYSGALITRKSVKNSFLYDYQMIKKGENLSERRNLLEENGKARDEHDVPLKTGRWSSKYLVYGPFGFLSRDWQPHFRYEIVDSERISGKRAVVVRATPREVTAENYCFGRLWIDESDGSVLQIEWEPSSIQGFQDKVTTQAGEMKRALSWTVRYDVVKNGIRFPGRQNIKEIYTGSRGREYTKYEAGYEYLKYKFFTVEIEVRYE